MTDQPVTVSELLDMLSRTVKLAMSDGIDKSVSWTLSTMTDRERVAFDLMLVRFNDPLAWQGGTVESRIRAWTKRSLDLLNAR